MEHVVRELGEAEVAFRVHRHRTVLADALRLVRVDRNGVDLGEDRVEEPVRSIHLVRGLVLGNDRAPIYDLGDVVLCLVENLDVRVLLDGILSEFPRAFLYGLGIDGELSVPCAIPLKEACQK